MNSFVYLIFASADAASHSAKHAAEPGIFISLVHANVFGVLLAFVFLAWVMKRFNVLSSIDKAQKKIIDDLKTAVSSKESSLKELEDAEERLSKAKEDAEVILNKAEESALRMKEEIIMEAEIEAKKIIEHAKKAVINEQEQARAELQRNLTIAAVEVAKDNIKTSIDDNWHKKIIQDFVDNLSEIRVK